MALIMFLVAAIIFFLDAAGIASIDPLWGHFFVALGLLLGATPFGGWGGWRRMR